MNDYYSVRISPIISVNNGHEAVASVEDINDLAASFLADAGFESFEPDDAGLMAYIPARLCSEKNAEEISREALAFFPVEDVAFSIASEFIKGVDWNEEWEKNYFKPILIDNLCVVHSTFHHDVPEAQYDIVIDPKMAFGTGHHDTTSQMMRLILSLPLENKTVIDMGTGTGILAILAKMRGATKVTGIEIDEPAYLNAVDHTELNKTDVDMIHGDATALTDLEPADYLFANINRNIIMQDFERYADALKPTGEMLLSGFYDSDVEVLKEKFGPLGFSVAESLVSPSRWTALRITRKNP